MKWLEVTWHDRGAQPTVRFDPAHVDGIIADVTGGKLPACRTNLYWPAPRCGEYLIRCRRCGFTAVVTTAGRVDDPREAIIPCKGVYEATR